MLARPYECYGCHADFITLPDKCSFCGEKLFLNLDYAGLDSEMYPISEEEKKKIRKEFESLRNNKEAEKEYNGWENIGMLANFTNEDHEDDVDTFGMLESDAHLIAENTVYNGTHEIIATSLIPHIPCVIVTVDYVTGNIISRYRGSFKIERGYLDGNVVYGIDPVVVSNERPMRVFLYSPLEPAQVDLYSREVTNQVSQA